MSKTSDDVKSLSEREVRIVAELEFKKQYYFRKKDIEHHFENASRINYTIHRLKSKKRIVKLGRDKYYLVPMKAKLGKWTDHPFIIADEMMGGEGYYIGGWAAANYWRLTEQVPMKYEIYTNKRNGRTKVLSTTFLFKKTTTKRIDNAKTKKIGTHTFQVLGKKESKEWLKSRNY